MILLECRVLELAVVFFLSMSFFCPGSLGLPGGRGVIFVAGAGWSRNLSLHVQKIYGIIFIFTRSCQNCRKERAVCFFQMFFLSDPISHQPKHDYLPFWAPLLLPGSSANTICIHALHNKYIRYYCCCSWYCVYNVVACISLVVAPAGSVDRGEKSEDHGPRPPPSPASSHVPDYDWVLATLCVSPVIEMLHVPCSYRELSLRLLPVIKKPSFLPDRFSQSKCVCSFICSF